MPMYRKGAMTKTDRIRGFYKAATAWNFDKEAEPHILAMQEKQVEEFDQWLNSVKAEVWDEAEWAFQAAHKWSNHEPWEHMKENPYQNGEDQ